MRIQLEARIERLPRHALSLAVAFASLGHTAELPVARRLAGVSEESLDEAVRVLRKEKILEQKVEGDPGELYSFVHSSARDLLYQRILEGRRAAIHTSAGTV